MSGLCGWVSLEPPGLPIEDMAAPFTSHLASSRPLRSAGHSLGAVALAARHDEASLYHQDGLLIVHWGERVEVLAQLWRTHGARACAALSGHFAFALLDERRGEALVAVDRCATRPLFYQMAGRSLLFASSGEALARHPGAGRTVDPQALFDYLYLHAVHGPRTMFAGQRRLAPGECLHLHGGRVERIRYWRMRYTEHAVEPAPQTELLDALTCALDCASDAGAALMLGGGCAGTLLATLLQRGAGQPVHSYAVGFGVGGERQLAGARMAARRIGSRHRERLLAPDDVADAVAALARQGDAPCGEPGAVAMLYAAQMAREDGHGRLHGGFGAAQLFGCGRHAALARTSRYERLPGALRQLAIEPLLFGLGAQLPGAFERVRARIEQALQPPLVRLRRRNALLALGAANVFEPAFLELVDPDAPAARQEETWWLAQARSAANRAVDLELQGELPCRILPAFSAACAAAGMQPVLPYLDDAVVAMAARLAPHHKSGKGARRLFVRALGEIGAGLPAAQRAPVLPFGRWLQGDARLRALAYDSLSGLARRRILHREFVDLLLARRLPEDPATHGETVWRLMMLEQWLARGRRDGFGLETDRSAAALVQA
ncbi:asparagine synthase-related protein [Massilia litorea]|uniref:asparagine synthase (glutamine-hydrolyzing) n=1 Tax=Massilia litorea TaxID=2769491 RepID=A0A7L9U1H4_9BURK|nr:asparagine synthase-related protein [Massilia litorea]QOL48798.1 asparagine synthase [Massilia litorea]